MFTNNLLLYFDWLSQTKYFYLLERGCPSAALRVWPWNERNRTPLELCGDSLEQHSKITSETNLMRVS